MCNPPGWERMINMKMKIQLTTGAIIGLIGGILIILATILPWASVPSTGVFSTDVMGLLTGFGTIVLIMGILGLVLALLSKGFWTILCGVVSLLITLCWYGALSFISSWFLVIGGTISLGYGTFFAIIGAILLIIGGIIVSEEQKAATAPAPASA
jgi:hypothetical protein